MEHWVNGRKVPGNGAIFGEWLWSRVLAILEFIDPTNLYIYSTSHKVQKCTILPNKMPWLMESANSKIALLGLNERLNKSLSQRGIRTQDLQDCSPPSTTWATWIETQNTAKLDLSFGFSVFVCCWLFWAEKNEPKLCQQIFAAVASSASGLESFRFWSRFWSTMQPCKLEHFHFCPTGRPVASACKLSSLHLLLLDVQALGVLAGDRNSGHTSCWKVPQSTGYLQGPTMQLVGV